MKRRAFTLIELVLVIVIIAILATIGIKILSSVYRNYIQSKSLVGLEATTEVVLEQIAKRLEYRIKPTFAARANKTDDYQDMYDIDQNSVRDIVWYMQSFESQRITGVNNKQEIYGWTGVISKAVANSSASTIDLTLDTTVKQYGKLFSLSAANQILAEVAPDTKDSLALYFLGGKLPKKCYYKNYNDPNDGECYGAIFKAKITDDKTIRMLDTKQENVTGVTDIYYLSHTLNSIEMKETSAGIYDLILKTNYLPWNDNKKQEYTLAHNVSALRFAALNTTSDSYNTETMVIKLCMVDPNFVLNNNNKFEVCKTKVLL